MLSVKTMKFLFPRLAQGSGAAVRKLAQGRSILLSCLTLVVLFLLTPAAREESAFGAASESGPCASAAGITGANALLNEARLFPGATLFRGDTLTLGANSSAALQFGNDL